MNKLLNPFKKCNKYLSCSRLIVLLTCVFLFIFTLNVKAASSDWYTPRLIWDKFDMLSLNEAQEKIDSYVEDLMERSYNEIISSNQKLKILFLIHGRGKNPDKVLTKDIPYIEEYYNLKVIVFNWPSWTSALGFPRDFAYKSSSYFEKVLIGLDNYFSKYPERYSFYRSYGLSLMTHSMGALVMENYLNKKSKTLNHKLLFNNLLIGSAATELKDHAKWVEKIDFTNQVYISYNDNDKVLKNAEWKLNGNALGRKIIPSQTTQTEPECCTAKQAEPLAKNAIYIDATKTNVNHAYYIRVSGQNKNVNLARFYNSLLRSESPLMTPNLGINRETSFDQYNYNVYSFSKKTFTLKEYDAYLETTRKNPGDIPISQFNPNGSDSNDSDSEE